MKNITMFLFAWLFFIDATHCQGLLREIESLSAKGCDGDMATFKVLNDHFRTKIVEDERQIFENGVSSNFEFTKTQADVKKIHERMNKIQIADDTRMANIKLGNFLIKTSVDGLASLTKTPFGNIAGTIVQNGLDFQLNKMEDMTMEYMDKNRTKILSSSLNNLYNEDKDAYNKILTSGNKYQSASTVEKQEIMQVALQVFTGNGTGYSEMSEGLKQSQKVVLNNHLIERLQEAFINQEVEQLAIDGVQNSEIRNNANQIVDLSARVEAHIKISSEKIEGLMTSQKKINESIKSLNNKVNKNSNDINFLQDFMYSKMSPEEKINAIKMDMVSMTEVQKAGELKKLEILAEQKAFMDNAKFYLGEASAFANIVSDLGIGGDAGKLIAEGVEIGSAAMNAAQNVMDGNYFSAVASLTGLMSKKRDVAGERFNVLKNMLGEVISNQEEMKKKLDFLFQGQRNIIQNQQAIMKSLISLSGQIENNHKVVLDNLENLNYSVLRNGELLNEIYAEAEINSIRDFFNDDAVEAGCSINYDSTVYPNYDSFQKCYSNYYLNDDLKNIFNTLRTNFFYIERNNPDLKIPPYYKTWSANYSNIGNSNGNRIYQSMASDFENVKSLYNYFINTSSINKNQAITQLYFPIKNLKNIQEKTTLTYDVSQNMSLLSYVSKNILNGEIEQPKQYLESLSLDAFRVDGIVKLLLDVSLLSPYYTNGYQRPATLNQMINGRSGSKVLLLSELRDAMFLLDISLIQETLKSGDILIPKMYELLARGLESEVYNNNTLKDEYARLAIKTLSKNNILRRNFINYYLLQRIEETGNSLSSFHFALNQKDTRLLKNVLNVSISKDVLELNEHVLKLDSTEYVEGKALGININGVNERIPTAKELRNPQMIYGEGVYLILERRKDVLTEIAKRTLFDESFDEDDMLSIYQMLLHE